MYNNLKEITERLTILLTVLQYSSEKGDVFTKGERICINQERASLLNQERHLLGELAETELRTYHISREIEQKVTYCREQIRKTNWQPKPLSEYGY